MRTHLFFLIIVSILFLPYFALASANFLLSPPDGSYVVGREFSIKVNIDSAVDPINAAKGKIFFDKDIVSVASISANPSIFRIWVDYPNFSNSEGSIIFSGGTPSPGFAGIGTIFTINFRGLKPGIAKVDFDNDAQVLANDGMGTDILSETIGGQYNILPQPPSVSCYASPGSVLVGQSTTFVANAEGGIGNYSYLWQDACQGNAKTCTNSFNEVGSKKAKISIISGSKTASSECFVSVGTPGLSVSCIPSLESVDVNTSLTFTAEASGGSGSYSYAWQDFCNGSDSMCTGSYDSAGLKRNRVTVTSDKESSYADCVVSVNNVCPEQLTCITPLNTVEVVKKFLKTPWADILAKTISTAGVVAMAVAVATNFVASSLSLFDILSMLIRFIGILLVSIGLKKRILPWGTVYDSITKQPLDPARVILKNSDGKEVGFAITDLDGRYGFLVDKGFYTITVNKTNYVFPSKKLFGKTKDEIYADLYFGEQIEVKESREPIIKNIPLDPINFNWNEYAKKNQELNRFWSKWDVTIRRISNISFVVGFIVSIVAYFITPEPYNIIIVCIYLFLSLLILIGLRPKTSGYIIDKTTGYPLPFSIIRIIIPPYNVEYSHKVVDSRGKYFCLVPKGEYFVQIEKKNDDDSYSVIYTSKIRNGSKEGVLREKFKV